MTNMGAVDGNERYCVKMLLSSTLHEINEDKYWTDASQRRTFKSRYSGDDTGPGVMHAVSHQRQQAKGI